MTYDDAEEGPPFDYPELPPLPTYVAIWDNPEAHKLAPYSDVPFRWHMPDSFWYYGVWYEPGDYLYFSSDGWISWDEYSIEAFPNPPTTDPPFPVQDHPNAVIAPLWQDMDPTQTPDPTDENRFYYLYDTDDKNLIIEWYRIQGHASTHEYTFEVVLQMGGQELLEVDDCGVLYSGHLIHFLYNTTSHGWDADNGATGLEDQTGTLGITYPAENLADGRVIRMGLSVQSKTEGYDIHFSIPSHTRVKLEVFDVSGRHLRTLADKTYTAGTHTLYWNGCDAKGHKIAQGVYLVHMEADGRRTTRKVVVY
jgi:hypothetical protein